MSKQLMELSINETLVSPSLHQSDFDSDCSLVEKSLAMVTGLDFTLAVAHALKGTWTARLSPLGID